MTCAGTHHAKYHTLLLCREILRNGPAGHFAECGVMAGAHPAIMEYALREFPSETRKIHLFDCFAGIPAIGPFDFPATQQIVGQSKCSVDQVKANLSDFGCNMSRFEFHVGKFEDTLAEDAKRVGPLALLRVDVDLYQSTRTVYDELYRKVVPGGYVVDDDYGEPGGGAPPCRIAMLESLRLQGYSPPSAVDVEGNPGTVWWRKT